MSIGAPDTNKNWPSFELKSLSEKIQSSNLSNNVELNKHIRQFAVFAASIHSQLRSYIFYGPITAAAWQRIGYEVIFIFVGDFSKNSNEFQINLTRTFLQRLGVHVIDFQCDISYAVKMSQLVRIFSGFLSDEIVHDTDYIITSDSDIIPIRENDYRIGKATIGFIYNAFCCGTFNRREKSYTMYPMSHICIPKKVWRNIFLESVQRQELLNMSLSSSVENLLSDKASFSFDTISLYTRHEFRHIYDSNMTKGDAAWFMDQIYSSMLLNDYISRHQNLIIDKREKKSKRLSPDSSEYFWQPQSLKSFGDAHLMHDEIFDSHNWAGFKNFLYYLFNSSLVSEVLTYYDKFIVTLRDQPVYN